MNFPEAQKIGCRGPQNGLHKPNFLWIVYGKREEDMYKSMLARGVVAIERRPRSL